MRAWMVCLMFVVSGEAGLAGEAKSLPAFPSAEGFGAAAVGGRGGRVIKVTNLNASGPGSLAAACAVQEPRIVVFGVSGVITGDVAVTHPQITIAGQTAPGAGITIVGRLKNMWSVKPSLHDIIVRFVRVRSPRHEGEWVSGDCVQFTDVDRVILDHVSCAWGNDENIDLCDSREVTVQWCAIEPSDTTGHVKGQHNFGMILGYAGRNATIHHNLFAHHKRRAPLCGLEVLDHRNNVIYNMRTALNWHPSRMNQSRPGKGFRANLIGNFLQAGPDAPKTGEDLKHPAIRIRGDEHLHAAGNVFTWAPGAADPWTHPLDQGIFNAYPVRAAKCWPAPPVVTHTAERARRLVLAHAGCLPRDALGRRTIKEVLCGTGAWGRHEPPGGLMAGLTPRTPSPDSDNDGLPDAWERAHGLDPVDPADSSHAVPAGASPGDGHAGYMWIEYYVNELADKLIGEVMGT